MRKIFLSSTAKDLQEYRDAVFAAIQACDDLHCVRMEDFGARAVMADEFCRAKVAECEVFVGIVGHYFGSSPKGSDKSYTQQEYDAAVETNKPRLMFIAPDDFPIPANLVENASKRKRQREFRARVNGVLRAEFRSPQDLATKVVTAIRNWEREQEQITMEQQREQYLAHVIGEWEKIRLIGFSHAGKVVDDPKLEQVFVPLRVESVASREPFEKGTEIEESPRTTSAALRRVLWRAINERDVTERKVGIAFALRVQRKAVVLGTPGAGKSTLLQWLALSFARGWHGAATAPVRDESRVPLRIVLREFARERSRRGAGYAVEDYLHDHYRARGQNFPSQFFCHFIERGECALLFDGMDEVGTAAQRIEMRDLIENLARAHPANRFIVTSRPKGYEAAPLDRREFYTFSILDFDDDAIRQFIENWYRAVEGKNEPEAKEGARLLSESLDANPNVKRLAVNPLMLTIIATIHRTERLPNQRVRLYDKCAESLLVKWDEVRGIGGAPIGEEEQRRRLEHIAYWMHSENIGDVERDELQRKLTRFLKPRYPDAADEASRFIDRLVERAGILVERSPDRFAFAHRTFQEYFAAMDIYNRYLDEEDPQIVHDAVMSHLHDPRWEEVSLLTMAKLKVKPTTKLLQAILSANSWGEGVLHRDLFFAARVLADDVMVERAVVERVVKELCDGLLHTHLREKLHREYIEILTWIARGENGGIATLILRDSHKRFLDSWCADWMNPLVARKEPETTQLLLDLTRPTNDEWVQRKAAEAWGHLGEKAQATQLLINLARTARSEFERLDVAQALGELGEKAQAAQLLLDQARTANNERMRQNAAEALGQLGEKSEVVVNGLLDLACTSSDLWVRRFAVRSLGQLGDKSQMVVDGLLDLVRTASDEDVRRLAAWSLGQLGEKSEAIVNGLLNLAVAPNSELVRYDAGRALGQLGEEAQAARLLLDLAHTTSVEWIRLSVVEALGEVGEKAQAAQLLLDLTRPASAEWVRQRAAKSLGKLGEEAQAVPLLLHLARTASNESVRQDAARSLGQLGGTTQAVPLLLDLALKARDGEVRRDAAQSLGELGEKTQSVLDGLLYLAQQDVRSDVQNAAYGALKQLLAQEELEK
ncbi:MAG: HEAT repeat domain-containing protein [Chloroflexi bacterium]|nr:HEAT repeat domain-containing protein [Chloroflexota bacterium]